MHSLTAPRYDATLSSRRSFPSRVFRVIWRSIDCCRGHTPHHNALERISEFECTESCLSPSSWASGRHVMKKLSHYHPTCLHFDLENHPNLTSIQSFQPSRQFCRHASFFMPAILSESSHVSHKTKLSRSNGAPFKKRPATPSPHCSATPAARDARNLVINAPPLRNASRA